MNQKPLVVLLDLDGTLVGRVTSVLSEYDIYKTIAPAKSSSRSSKAVGNAPVAPNVPKHIRESIISRLRYGIIRPHVIDFCRGVAEMGAGIELFVFTASENTWANFFVPCVESALGIRFNRPIFTRNHCVMKQLPTPNGSTIGGANAKNKSSEAQVFYGGVSILKSIVKLRPMIVRSLRSRYPELRAPGDLVDRVILLDNTPHVMADPRESARLVVCPTYDYVYVYDVLAHLPVDVLHSGFRQLVPILQRNGMFPTGLWLSLPGASAPSRPASAPHSSHSASPSAHDAPRRIETYSSFAAVYYRRLARLLDAAAEPNEIALGSRGDRGHRDKRHGDRFFLHLLHALRMLLSRRLSEDCFDDAGMAELSATLAASEPRHARESKPRRMAIR